MKSELISLPSPFVSSAFDPYVLVVESPALRNNRLGDTAIRHNYLLLPKKVGDYPVVVHLSGYLGNGPQSFNIKAMEKNFPEVLAEATAEKKLKPAVHVFVDGTTLFGGSQFLNSPVCGRYSDYLQKDLPKALEQQRLWPSLVKHRWLMGSSSGGYGALHHVSLTNSPYGGAMALAPDSHFETSLLPDYYKAAPHLQNYATIVDVKSALRTGTLQKTKNFFEVMNAIAMTACYATQTDKLNYPIDLKTGELKPKVWAKFQANDPVHFLQKRTTTLKKKKIVLKVGTHDDFALYFGARHINELLKKSKVAHTYMEFEGTHFNLNPEKIKTLQSVL